MALNVATLVSTLASGPQASAADVAVIQNVSSTKRTPTQPRCRKSRTLFLTSTRICRRCCSRHTLGTQCCQRASRLRESDSDHGEQFCCINSPGRAFGFSFNFAESPHASTSWRESLKEAVEPANLRADRKYRARWGPDSSPRMVEDADLRLSEIDR